MIIRRKALNWGIDKEKPNSEELGLSRLIKHKALFVLRFISVEEKYPQSEGTGYVGC